MEKGRRSLIIVIISTIGGWGTAIITNWDDIFGDGESALMSAKEETISTLKIDLSLKENEFDNLTIKYNEAININRNNELLIQEQKTEIVELKIPFHEISNTKLKQLVRFHNDAVCYGRSLNFTHDSSNEYEKCVVKDVLAKRFLLFFEELELTKENNKNYSRERAKQELENLQYNYNFRDPGWYTESMLGILIIEYAKKA